MGGDQGPPAIIGGVHEYLKAHDGRNLRFLLHGDETAIRAEMARLKLSGGNMDIRHTDKVIPMGEKPAQALRRGKGTSLWNAVESIRAGEAHAAVSAGNTGAMMAISKLILRMAVPALERPAIVANWPTARGISVVLDVGANIDCGARQLVEFAIMGESFHAAVHGSTRPTIGLLNVGSEDNKGHDEVREAHRILREWGQGLDYRGFVEGDDIAKGTVDIIVTDGFTGNIALKTTEGTIRFLLTLLKESLTSTTLGKVGALMVKPALRTMVHRIDPGRYNGAPLLGLNGLVVKSHGSTNAAGFASAIRVAVDLARSDYLAKVAAGLERLGDIMEATPEATPEEAPVSQPVGA
ncbi:phosphate acyltransferase PlsX [Brevundimonas sp. M20]|uniref:phosphate acyltransferase PlsX n=1 Tax=Brevundimonas sp. M20 TaxID=2591463 RepID=UPI0011476293|nr:phosphate acyltransferase PlsX [Brevundimonas sp. M20]